MQACQKALTLIGNDYFRATNIIEGICEKTCSRRSAMFVHIVQPRIGGGLKHVEGGKWVAQPLGLIPPIHEERRGFVPIRLNV
jgi:hypothetical protein